MYVDDSQKNLIADITDKDKKTVKDIHAMTFDEALAITGNYDDTNGIRNTCSNYWLGSAYSGGSALWFVGGNGRVVSNNGYCWGIRPVVSMKSGVYIKSGDGSENSPYVLGIEE